jgi:lipid A disaccharide synthetase
MVIAGEASGDRIAAPVLRALREKAAERHLQL